MKQKHSILTEEKSNCEISNLKKIITEYEDHKKSQEHEYTEEKQQRKMETTGIYCDRPFKENIERKKTTHSEKKIIRKHTVS